MNETTLNALINLFALFSAKSGISRNVATNTFTDYLKLHLGISYADEYLRLFDLCLSGCFLPQRQKTQRKTQRIKVL